MAHNKEDKPPKTMVQIDANPLSEEVAKLLLDRHSIASCLLSSPKALPPALIVKPNNSLVLVDLKKDGDELETSLPFLLEVKNKLPTLGCLTDTCGVVATHPLVNDGHLYPDNFTITTNSPDRQVIDHLVENGSIKVLKTSGFSNRFNPNHTNPSSSDKETKK